MITAMRDLPSGTVTSLCTQWEAERETYRAHVFVAAGPEFERGLLDGRTLPSDEAIDVALSSDEAMFDRTGPTP